MAGMTVRMLMAELAQCDPDAWVEVADGYYDSDGEESRSEVSSILIDGDSVVLETDGSDGT